MKLSKLVPLFASIVLLSGCSISVDKLRTDKVVLAKEVVQIPGNFAPKGITKTFSTEDPFVNVFVTINWDKDTGAGVKPIKWEWITDGKVMHEVKANFNFYEAPFYITGNVKTDAMGSGKHTVKLYIQKKLFAEENFEIK